MHTTIPGAPTPRRVTRTSLRTMIVILMLVSMTWALGPAEAAPREVEDEDTIGTWDITATVDGEAVPLETTLTQPDDWLTTATAEATITAESPATVRAEISIWYDDVETSPSFDVTVWRYDAEHASLEAYATTTASSVAEITIEDAGHYAVTFASSATSGTTTHDLEGTLADLDTVAPPALPAYEVPGLGDEKRASAATDALERHCERGAAKAHSKHCA